MTKPKLKNQLPVFLYEKNSKFINNERREPIHSTEILDNLKIKYGYADKPRGWGCIFSFFGFIPIVTGVMSLMIAVIDEEFTTAFGIVATILLSAGCFFLYRIIAILRYNPIKPLDAYRRLLQSHVVLTGKIIGLHNQSNTRISYSFDNPEGRKLRRKFVTHSDKFRSIPKGTPVVVLYVDDDLNILL